MTTQAVSITTGNGMMSKIFTLDATDGQWDGNVLTDSIASQSIGILIPNATLTYAQAQYEAGVMAFRLQDARKRFKSRLVDLVFSMVWSAFSPHQLRPSWLVKMTS